MKYEEIAKALYNISMCLNEIALDFRQIADEFYNEYENTVLIKEQMTDKEK